MSLFILGADRHGCRVCDLRGAAGRAGTVRGMIGIFFTPIVGTILGVTFRNDALAPGAVIGMGIVIVGAVMTADPEPLRAR